MELDTASPNYQLIFEGPLDSSDDTLRKIKGTFLADLEMPAEQILSILQSTPATVKEAQSPEDLERAYTLLKEAGSKVLIVSSDGKPWEPAETKKFTDLIMFELDQGAESPISEISPMPDPHTYTLAEETDSDLDNLLKEAAAGLEDDNSETIAPVVESRNTFTLELESETTPPLPDPASVEVAPAPAAKEPEPFNLTLALEDELPAQPIAAKVEKETPAPLPSDLGLSLDDADQPAAAQPLPEEPEAAPAPEPEPYNLSLSLDAPDEAPAAPQPVAAKEPVSAALAELPSLSLSIDAPEVKAAVEAPAEPPALEPQHTPVPRPVVEPEMVKKQTPISPLVPAGQAASEHSGPPTDINLVSVRDLRKKKLSPQQETVAYILIGSMLLFLANWIYFNQPPPVNDVDLNNAQEIALKVAQKKKELMKKQLLAQEELKKQAEAQKPREYVSDFVIEDYHFQLSMKLAGSVPQEASLSVVSPPQPEPTNEQIARGEAPPPWIRRLESTQLELNGHQDGTISGSGLAKVFIEYQGVPTRLIRQVQLEGGPVDSTGTLPVTLTVVEADAPTPADDSWKLEATGDTVTFSMRQKLQLSVKEVESAPETTPPEAK